jgi:ornithine decarboxylase
VNASAQPDSFASVEELLLARRPHAPVYCIYPHVYRETAREFVAGFPGRVLYAVKANAHPGIVRLLNEGGVTHFDCASVPEIELVREACDNATPYFMVPVRLRGAARDAQERLGVRHFMVDHLSAIEPLAAEIDLSAAVVFARMAAHHDSAMQDLSTKFGAQPEEMPELLQAIKAAGAEPALAFNVGSGVTSVVAYAYAIELAESVLRRLPFKLRLIDIGGGYPKSYPGFAVPPLERYFSRIAEAASRLSLAEDGEILGEPGRALAAPGLSAVVELLLRKDDRLYINDGMYGIFWELRFRGHKRYPVRCYRDGREVGGETQPFTLYGPTCDATDTLPGEVDLPCDVAPGDHLEFGSVGAYSLSGRTDFNGHYSDDIVTITDATPP